MRHLAMILLTIREAVLRGTLLFYFAVGNIIILFMAYALDVSPDDPSMITFLSNPLLPKNIGNTNPVDFVLIQLQRSSASSILLFGVFAVAGLIPSMLEKGTVELYLSKPLSRTALLLSRASGATAGVALNLIYFAIGIWLVFGIKLAIWHSGFLFSFLFVCIAFLFYFSIVTFVGIVTRSAGFSIMFAFLYTFFSSALESRTKILYQIWNNDIYHTTLDVLYYCTPQLSAMLENSSRIIGKMPFPPDQLSQTFDILPFVYSLLSSAAIYALASFQFAKQDF
jgi:ABC-type transport system involved in multi-copper enzyme maturation permease subunit